MKKKIIFKRYISGRKTTSKQFQKLARSNYLLFMFWLILKLSYLPSTNYSWTDSTMADRHFHSIVHTLKGYDTNLMHVNTCIGFLGLHRAFKGSPSDLGTKILQKY